MAIVFKGLFLSKKESRDPDNFGWKYVYEHKDDWVDLPILDPAIEGGYDYGTTFFVKDNICYAIQKDFIVLDNGDDPIRLMILTKRDNKNDIIPEPESEEESSDELTD